MGWVCQARVQLVRVPDGGWARCVRERQEGQMDRAQGGELGGAGTVPPAGASPEHQ